MFILRLFAVAFLVLAAIAAGAEMVLWVSTGAWNAISAGQFWYAFDAESLAATHAFIQRDLYPVLWDPVMSWILRQPAWLVTGVPGALLLWLDVGTKLSEPRNARRPRFRTTG